MPTPAPSRRRRSIPLLVAGVSLGVLATACGDQEAGTAPLDPSAPVAIDDAPCDDGADCADAVQLGQNSYVITCAEPDEAELGAVVGRPGSRGEFDEARAIDGEPTELVVALHGSPGPSWCSGGEWVLGIGGNEGRTEEAVRLDAHLRCEVPAVPDDHRCVKGGPFWVSTDPSQDGTAGDGRSAVWLPDVVAATQAELVGGAGPQWRLDPLEVVLAEVRDYAARDSFHDEQEILYRAGLRTLEDSENVVVVEAMFQSGYDQGSAADFASTQRERYTLEQIGEGPGWYVTEFLITEYGGDGGTTLEAADDAWAQCCDLVITNLDRRDGGG